MPLSPIDLYRDVLPQTNCGDCGYPTCLAFASMVVSEQLPLSNCPHLEPDVIDRCEKELKQQYADKKWTKRNMAEDALKWARERSASMALSDLPARIGGELIDQNGQTVLKLPYFSGHVMITPEGITTPEGEALTRYEQVFLYIHMAQGGRVHPTSKWKSLVEFPNTVSKIKSMKSHVEAPLIETFSGRSKDLLAAGKAIGGKDQTQNFDNADVALLFQVLPRVPVLLMFWEASPDDGFAAEAKLLFDETITEHLDIESIMFLSERIAELLIEQGKT
ncbi:MAG: DUF3786 domain-containing protein [Desulfobacterales bacterium]